MKLKEGALITLISSAVVLPMAVSGCTSVARESLVRQIKAVHAQRVRERHEKQLKRKIRAQYPSRRSRVPTNPQEYQRFMDTKRHYDNQTRKGKWAGQYKSGKPIRRIPTESYNGYRNFREGMEKGY